MATPEAVFSQTRDGIGDTIIGHCLGNHYIASVFIIIREEIVSLKGDNSRFISVVQIVEDTLYLCVVSPRRKGSP